MLADMLLTTKDYVPSNNKPFFEQRQCSQREDTVWDGMSMNNNVIGMFPFIQWDEGDSRRNYYNQGKGRQ